MPASRLRTFARLAFANPASLVYLGMVLVSALPMAIAEVTGQPGPMGIWLVLATAPTSPLLLAFESTTGPGDAPAFFFGAVAFAALLHSFVLGLAYRAVRAHRTHRPANALV
ncbi:SCO4225 family membrane protein [Streptomyces sp. NPDC056144]|uniref:SCO4225 family membrane protein n=1 Tax=unclassified Streptomyces TaxID=2593676 RepID=UPI0035DC81E0